MSKANAVATAQALSAAVAAHRAGQLQLAAMLYGNLLSNDPDNPEVVLPFAICLHEQGSYQRAEELLSRARRARPASYWLHVALGRTLKSQGRLGEAVASYRSALELNAEGVEALIALGIALRHLGELGEALEVLERALRLSPASAEAMANLGGVLVQIGRSEQAIGLLQQAAQLRPDLPEVHNNLGKALTDVGREDEAIDSLQRALDLRHDFTEALVNSGLLMRKRGALRHAAECFSAAAPSHPPAMFFLGQVLYDQGDFEGALESFDAVAGRVPDQAGAHIWRGIVLHEQGRLDAALEAFGKAAQCDPGSAEALTAMASVHGARGEYGDALDAVEAGLEQAPDHAALLTLMGNITLARGCVGDALAWYGKASSAQPHAREAAQNALFAHCYSDEIDVESLFEAHREWGRQQQQWPAAALVGERRSPGSVVRIGLVSADFNQHSVAHFVEPLIDKLDRNRFRVICYYSHRRVDRVTKRLSERADQWRSIAGVSDEVAARAVAADQVDLLIDLAGHTAGSRLGLFGHRAARVQATYLGYPTTTGLPAIDFRISDWTIDPSGYERYNVEQLVRLDGSCFCYRPPDDSPEVADSPVLAAGSITFGSFNNLSKVSDTTIALWANVLAAVPRSRLLLKTKALADPAACKLVLARFQRHGIEAGRVACVPWNTEPSAHLSTYRSVDIALDTYPYNGATTTCEALWMGVPVVTLQGPSHAARMGASILRAAELEGWIAQAQDDYVDKCRALASDPQRLLEARRSARDRLVRSRLLDQERFVRGFESTITRLLCPAVGRATHAEIGP